MSIFSAIANFFKHIFQKLRPGIDGFLQKYEKLGIEIITKLKDVHGNASFHEWKDEAFNEIKAELLKDEKDIKDNWISILVSLAYEEIKATEEKKD